MSGAQFVYDTQIESLCSRVRTLALELAEIESQKQSLDKRREDRIEAYNQLKDRLHGIVREAVKVLHLEGNWVCDLSTGKLIQKALVEDK